MHLDSCGCVLLITACVGPNWGVQVKLSHPSKDIVHFINLFIFHSFPRVKVSAVGVPFKIYVSVLTIRCGDNFHFECWVITGLQGKPWVGLCNFGKLLGEILNVRCRSALLQSNVPLVLWSYVWVNRLSNLREGFWCRGLVEYYVKKGNYWLVVIKMCIVWAL